MCALCALCVRENLKSPSTRAPTNLVSAKGYRPRWPIDPSRPGNWRAGLAVPVAGQLTRGAFLGGWRLMAVDGFEWDAPDSRENAAAFGYAGAGADRGAFPKVRVVTVSECASHAVVDAEIGPSWMIVRWEHPARGDRP